MSQDIAMLGIGVDTTGLKAGARELDNLQRKGDQAEQSTQRLSKSVDFLTRVYKDLAKAAAAWKVYDLIRDSTMLAARFETMGVVMNVAGNNAGYTRKEMRELELQMRASGISMIATREGLTSLATANIDLAKALKISKSAQDLAVVAGINSSEAFTRMVHGIKSGETEILKTMGLNVSFENSYKKLALQLGINRDALTEQQKTMARTDAVLEQAAGYAGIYEESMTTAGKAITSLTRYWEDFKVKAGEAFLPALSDGVFRLTDALKAANKELDRAGSEGVISKIGTGLATAFRYVYETVVVLGAEVGHVFNVIGMELGAWGAQAAAVLRGDFAGAGQIRKDLIADQAASRAATDAFTAAILRGTSASQQAAQAGLGEAAAQEQKRIAAGAARRAEEAAEAARLAAAEKARKAADKARKEAEATTKQAREYLAGLELERRSIGATEQQLKMMAAAKEAAKVPGTDLARIIMETALALTIEAQAYKDAEEAQRAAKDAGDAHLQSMAGEVQAAVDATEAERLAVETYGMLAPAITRVTMARLEAKRAALNGVEGTEDEILKIDMLIRANEKLLEYQNRKQDLDDAFDPGKAESFGEALKKAFSGAGDAMSGLANALGDYMVMQETAEKDRQKAMLAHKGDAERMQKALDKINNKERKDSINAYGEMAGASKKFFKEHTAGYKVLDAVEKAFHAWKMITMGVEFAQKMGLITATTAAAILGNSQQATSAVAGAAVEVSAKQAVAGANAVAGVANQANGDPYTAFFRMAAMAAIMAGLGLAVGGGGGAAPSIPLSKQRQDANGTGSVLGDSSAKSESLANSLELLAENSNIALEYSSSMLATLRNINDGIAGMARFVARSSGLRGTPADQAALGVGSSKSFLGFSTSSTELRDQGIFLGIGQTIGSIMAGGIQASSYADLHKEKSSWWGLSKSSSDTTEFGDLNAGLKEQLTLTVEDMFSGVLVAAKALGVGGDDLAGRLEALGVGIDRISLMGLSGDDIEAELQAAFSKFGDDMATAAAPHLAEFQKVGEGMFETLIRVANGVEVAQFELERFGITSVDYSQLANKSGDVAAEIVRQSIVQTERFGDALTGVGQILLDLDGTATELADTYAQLRDIQAAMVAIGVDGYNLTRETLRGARDPDTLARGLDTFFDRFLSDAEKAAALTARMSAEFARIGITTMPRSIAEFATLARGIDQTAASGQFLFGQLMGMTDGFVEWVDAVETAVDAAAEAATAAAESAFDDLARAIEAATDAENALHKGRMESLNAELKAQKETYDTLKRLASGLSSTLERMKMPGLESVDRAAAQIQIAQALATARATGVLPTIESLQSALSIVSQPAEELFGSFEEYQADFYATALKIDELKGLTDTQLGTAERTLSAIERAIEAENRRHEDTVTRLQAQLDKAQEQLDALNGVRTDVQSVGAALAAFSATVAAAMAAAAAAAAPAIAPVGLAPLVTGPASLVQAPAMIPAFANGGAHAGGWRQVGERGTELEYTGPSSILSHSTSSSLFDSSGLSAEIREMRDVLFRALLQVADNTGKASDVLDGFERNGLPQERNDEETEVPA